MISTIVSCTNCLLKVFKRVNFVFCSTVRTTNTQSIIMDRKDIPVVDFADFSLDKKEEEVDSVTLIKLANEVIAAFMDIGFIYLKNHGISLEQQKETFDLAEKFFNLPMEIKNKYVIQDCLDTANYHGYCPPGRENLNPKRPNDLKELYDAAPQVAKKWPDEEMPDFRHIVETRHRQCTELANRIQYLMGLGLCLDNVNLFRENLNPYTKPNSSCFRLLYYPPLPEDVEIKPSQIRCGEHTDFGAITLLFQDEIGGLEIQQQNGEFIPAVPIAGTVLVNVGDLVQRWTADKLHSTMHRVVLPKDTNLMKIPRISFAYFAQSDDDCLVECVDGSNKYPPIKSLKHLQNRVDETFNY